MKGPGMRGKGTEARAGEDLRKNAKKIDLTLDLSLRGKKPLQRSGSSIRCPERHLI